MVTVVLDAQAGSCGKGKFIGYLANKDHVDVAINNFMSNSGHTYESEEYGKIVTQHLHTSMVNMDTELVIGPGAAITPDILFNEIIRYRDIIGNRKIKINPRAAVIFDKHRETEKRVLRSGSTFKGCGAAQSDKVMRQAELFGDYWKHVHGKDNGDYDFIKSHIEVMDTMQYINDSIDRKEHVLVEGSQGCDLDINYGLPYPNTTSRQCHAGQLVADCGISPKLVDEIVMIMRPYPIRISNITDLYENDKTMMISSGDYAESEEITWDIIRKRCGAPANIWFDEYTTVTKKIRRVFEMNWDRLKYVTKLNRPTMIALNFAQYIDWNAYKCKHYDDLPAKVLDFIFTVEKITKVPVKLIGTGADNNDIIDLR